jgi:Putative peptidoglycan binding domain
MHVMLKAIGLVLAMRSTGWSQTPAATPPGQPRPAAQQDPRLLAAQQAYEALPEADRRSIQRDLGFAAGFSGAALGGFGSLTYTAIQNFQRDNALATDGILTPQARQLLATKAAAVRTGLKFAVLDDTRTGAKIGVPQSLFTRREPIAAGGSRWQTADGKATLDTTAVAAGGETLQQLYEKALVSSNPARKVTYKLLRPDFFVVAGETPTGKFYRRMTAAPDGAMRGFSISYDKALAGEMDRLVISVANSFDAFPSANPAAASALAAAQRTVAAQTASAALPAPSNAPRERLASGLVLEGGFVLTADSGVKDCKTLAVGPRKSAARVVASDNASGLALLKADGLTRSGTPLTVGGVVNADAALTVVSQAWVNATPGGVFSQGLTTRSDRIAAPLQPGGAGAALFDASGALAGVVVDDPGARRQVAGVVPAARYRFATADDVTAFLQKQQITLAKADPARPVGNVAAARRDAVIAVSCGL